ncbi:MAG: TIGR01777 family oxidoreductase [Bacilli bacterium]
MRCIIFGGTGLIGSALAEHLATHGNDVWTATRGRASEERRLVHWDPTDPTTMPADEYDVVINLSGLSLNAKRWSKQVKEQILETRRTSTAAIVRWMSEMTTKPELFINASAVGIYGTESDTKWTERDLPSPSDFLSSVVHEWEQAAHTATSFGIRTVCTRFGVVLSRDGGALANMVMPYRLFAGGRVGSGKQRIAWVHIDDVVGAIHHIIENYGIYASHVNVVAPGNVSMDELGRSIGQTLRRPHIVPAPAFALSLLLGEMSTLVLDGQFVVPEQLIEHGYTFKFPTIQAALADLLV